jgi:hypothetical protein
MLWQREPTTGTRQTIARPDDTQTRGLACEKRHRVSAERAAAVVAKGMGWAPFSGPTASAASLVTVKATRKELVA